MGPTYLMFESDLFRRLITLTKNHAQINRIPLYLKKSWFASLKKSLLVKMLPCPSRRWEGKRRKVGLRRTGWTLAWRRPRVRPGKKQWVIIILNIFLVCPILLPLFLYFVNAIAIFACITSNQYAVRGFEFTTSWLLAVWINHYTKAPRLKRLVI